MKYNPEICGKISAEDEKAVFDGLLKYNMEYLEDKEPKDLGIYIRDDNHQVKAGLIGLTHGNWLIIRYLWVHEDMRGQGIGARLLKSAETEAKKRRCKYVFLDTFSFQAPDFYKKYGYQERFVLEDYPVKGKRHYFTKKLTYPVLEKNPLLYAGLIQVIKRGTAEILEENENGIFLKDSISNGFMLVSDNFETSVGWLKKYEYLNYRLLSVFREDVAGFVRMNYGLTETLECFQAVYQSQDYQPLSGNLRIEAATEEKLDIIMSHYKKLDEWEVREVINRGNLFIGYHKDEVVGFIGQHLEGSMGILEVFPEYRRKGYGTELERFMINHTLEEEKIPFCQIETDNEKSLELQRKLGLTLSEDKVYWLF